jgi:hypothetical protein
VGRPGLAQNTPGDPLGHRAPPAHAGHCGCPAAHASTTTPKAGRLGSRICWTVTLLPGYSTAKQPRPKPGPCPSRARPSGKPRGFAVTHVPSAGSLTWEAPAQGRGRRSLPSWDYSAPTMKTGVEQASQVQQRQVLLPAAQPQVTLGPVAEDDDPGAAGASAISTYDSAVLRSSSTRGITRVVCRWYTSYRPRAPGCMIEARPMLWRLTRGHSRSRSAAEATEARAENFFRPIWTPTLGWASRFSSQDGG